jgi:hypothetical protein
MQSQDDRDADGYAARRERDDAVKEFVGEEITGQYEGEELEQHRERRPTPDRIRRLEKKHDEVKDDLKNVKDDLKNTRSELKGDIKDVRSDVKTLSGHVSNLSAGVAGAVGKIDGQQGVLSEMLSIVKKTADRDHVTFTAKVEIDKEKELARVEVDKEKELAKVEVDKEMEVAKVEVDKEKEVDVVKARQDRRKRNLIILGLVSSGVASGAAIIELLHRIGWL